MTSSERFQEGKLFVELVALTHLLHSEKDGEEGTLCNLYHARIAG